ncbi:hypothetical protein [Inquilinus limosus]|uniref:Uncharacterized protein n=1 Tax=Inquilinus limosus TaxID=171674 RepID=A0A211Z6D2_9PROT|nr:hypothetical protein [Inquilinus limosus]OWJ60812.1 hypothetical protein BWR60_31770 [Inquilinus limosus]
MTANAILALLDSASIPWTASRAELMDRYGIRRDPWYDDDIVLLETPQPLVPGLMRPIGFRAVPRFAPWLPPVYLGGHVHQSGDPRRNLDMAAAALSTWLGPGRPSGVSNTRGWRWQEGLSIIELTCWPPELQHPGLQNRAHEREPRLSVTCHLTICTGYRPPVTPEEQAGLDGFEEIGRLAETELRIAGNDTPEYALEFIRAPSAAAGRFTGRVGLSRGGGHLIFGWDELYLVAVDRILRFELLHLLPARGPGGATLSVRCATAIPAWPEKQLVITTALGIDPAAALASRLAGATGKTIERSTALDD